MNYAESNVRDQRQEELRLIVDLTKEVATQVGVISPESVGAQIIAAQKLIEDIDQAN
jgi:hypothetical protein